MNSNRLSSDSCLKKQHSRFFTQTGKSIIALTVREIVDGQIAHRAGVEMTPLPAARHWPLAGGEFFWGGVIFEGWIT